MLHAIVYHLYMLEPCVVLGKSEDAAFGALRDELLSHFVPGSDHYSAIVTAANIQEIEIALRSELEYLDEFPIPHILRHDITAACVIIYQLRTQEHPWVVVDEDEPAAVARLRAELAEALAPLRDPRCTRALAVASVAQLRRERPFPLAFVDSFTCPVAETA
jgi:hypothetical protein